MIADRLGLSVSIGDDQIRIDLGHLFGYEAVLGKPRSDRSPACT
jgi:hypothetical protein